jgi:hypothetical protein
VFVKLTRYLSQSSPNPSVYVNADRISYIAEGDGAGNPGYSTIVFADDLKMIVVGPPPSIIAQLQGTERAS